MKLSKKSKILALTLSAAMLISAFTFSVSAATVTLSESAIVLTEVGNIVTVTVPFVLDTDGQQATILATVGATADIAYNAENQPTNIVYIDQELDDGQFNFSFDKSTLASTDKLFVKVGGTDVALPGATLNGIPIGGSVTPGVKVFGYVATAGATVTLKDGVTTVADANGRFEFTGVAAGDYQLAVSAKSALTRTIAITVADVDFEVSVDTKKIDLMFGDTDSNGKIELEDLTAVKAAFNKISTDVGYNTSLDLDSNGKIELEDLTTIKANFNKLPSNYGSWSK